eukprot:PITA_11078
MEITLKLDAKPIKQNPYRLNPKCKEKVHLELDKMLEANIIEPVEEYDWINIAPEDKSKTTFATEWGCFQYRVMPFGPKNSPTIFSHVAITTFKEFIHKVLEVYFDDWIVFGLVQCHVESLCLMLDKWRRYQIALNVRKYLFYVPFRILLGHVVCIQGLMVVPTNIVKIINLEAPRSVKQLRATLGHTRYYRKFIQPYAQITAPMDKLLKKDATFYWNEEFQCSLDVLKDKMVTMSIFVFPEWKKELHVHVDASCIALRAVLTQA